MADKSWMLNPKAIRHANDCIRMIKDNHGVRLKLSQPDFLNQLHSFVERTKSRKLGNAYSELLGMAGVGNVLQALEAEPAHAVVAQPKAVGDYNPTMSQEMVNLEGHMYPKFRNGREFKGLYGGVPRYR